MSEQETLGLDPYFFNIVTMFASSTWCQLGKIANPVNGKLEKDLQGAKATIDTLIMLRDKTNGNLTKKEEEMLTSTISNLQINYADEAAKPETKIEEKVDNKTKENE